MGSCTGYLKFNIFAAYLDEVLPEPCWVCLAKMHGVSYYFTQIKGSSEAGPAMLTASNQYVGLA